MDYDELVQRLRSRPFTYDRDGMELADQDVEHDAADAIVALQARVAELERDLSRALAIAPSNAIAWQDRAIGAEMERDQYRHERDAYREAMAKMNAPAIALAALQPPPPINLTKLRLEDELVHGNVMGRIAIALFGDQNNRTDEECVARAAEIGYQLTGTQEALFQAQEAAKMLTSEVAELRDQNEFNETALKGYRNNIDALRHDIARHVQIAAEQAQELEDLRSDLAAARALLLYIRNTLCKPWGDPLMQRIDAALAG